MARGRRGVPDSAVGVEWKRDRTTARGGVDSPGRTGKCRDERRDGSSLSQCLMPSAKTYFAAIDTNRASGVVRALIALRKLDE